MQNNRPGHYIRKLEVKKEPLTNAIESQLQMDLQKMV